MKFNIIETQDILYVDRKVIDDEDHRPARFVSTQNIVLSDQKIHKFYLYDLRDRDNDIWFWLNADAHVENDNFMRKDSAFDYYDFYLAPKIYQKLPSQIDEKDLLKITFYPEIQTNVYFDEKFDHAIKHIVEHTKYPAGNLRRLVEGYDLFEKDQNLYTNLWKPMVVARNNPNYLIRRDERFATLLNSYLLFDAPEKDDPFDGEENLTQPEKALMRAGQAKWLEPLLTGENYFFKILYKKRLTALKIKEKYDFDEMTDLKKAQQIISSPAFTLKELSKQADIPYQTLKHYSSNLSVLENISWKKVHRLAEIYNRSRQDARWMEIL